MREELNDQGGDGRERKETWQEKGQEERDGCGTAAAASCEPSVWRIKWAADKGKLVSC